MENIEFEFLDRAISVMKEGDDEAAARIIADESELSIYGARNVVISLHQMLGE